MRPEGQRGHREVWFSVGERRSLAEPMAESGSKRRALIVAIAAGGCVLLPALLIALVMVLHHPFQTGESIASLEIEPGTAFELRYVSDGEPQHVGEGAAVGCRPPMTTSALRAGSISRSLRVLSSCGTASLRTRRRVSAGASGRGGCRVPRPAGHDATAALDPFEPRRYRHIPRSDTQSYRECRHCHTLRQHA